MMAQDGVEAILELGGTGVLPVLTHTLQGVYMGVSLWSIAFSLVTALRFIPSFPAWSLPDDSWLSWILLLPP
jgi:hypothetical protein